MCKIDLRNLQNRKFEQKVKFSGKKRNFNQKLKCLGTIKILDKK